jgi:hypothetical protein
MRPATRSGFAATAGYSLVELMVAMGMFTLIMGVTLTGLASVMQGNELVMTVSNVNDSVRAGVDLMIRDLLQTGSGLPAAHAVSIPNGAGSVQIRIPGPPGQGTFQTEAGDLVLPAVMPRNAQGPTIDGVSTDTITILMADNAFLDVALSAVADSSVTIAAGPNIANGPDRVAPGQLMLISKGSYNTLVQVTAVDDVTRVLTFADGDSLRLNQSGAEKGNLPALNAEDPVDDPAATRISRMRMISYYLDSVTDPDHPRLIRRVNNGDPGTFDNNLGTAVAIDAVDLQFTYDISNGISNPGGVQMSPDDMNGTGECNPVACAETQIRKVNLLLQSRSPERKYGFFENVLESQVSLRSMAFVDRYR